MNRNKCDDEELQQTGKKIKCSLGVNKKTGRLQWCPDSKYRKMLIIVPATLIPIVVVLLILTHLNVVGTVQQDRVDSNYLSLSNVLDSPEERRETDRLRCVAVRYSMSETFDSAETELMKDIRTSFIPPDSLLIPPHCKNSVGKWSKNSAINEAIRDEIDDLAFPFYKYLLQRRRRRSGSTNYTLDEVLEGRNFEADNDQDVDDILDTKPHVPVEETENENPRNSISENDRSTGQSIWKDRNSFEEVRAAQAKIMLQYMDQSVDPCEDFYQVFCV